MAQKAICPATISTETMIELRRAIRKLIDCPVPPSSTAVSTSIMPSTRCKLISVACTGSSELVFLNAAVGKVNAVRSIQ